MNDPDLNLACLLLAAGGSKRLGQPKQLVEVNGEALVLRTARLLLTQSPNVTVVTGAYAAKVGRQLRGLRVSISRNEGWRSGMGGSIAHGMSAIGDSMDGVLILLCDQWRIQQEDLQGLVSAWRKIPSEPVVARWDKSFGAPAIFPYKLFGALRQLEKDRGAKALIARQLSVQFMDIPNASFDLDTASDLQAMQSGVTGTGSVLVKDA